MSTPTLPEGGSAARGGARRWLPRLRDARIRSKLALILVVPVAAVVALAAARLVESGQRAADAGLVRELAVLATDVSDLAHETHRERMSAARLLQAPGTEDPTVFNAQSRRTDERIVAYTEARKALGEVPQAVEERLARIDEHLATLNGTRQDVISNEQVSVSEAVLRYGVIITDLVAYGEVLGQIAGEGELADGLRATAAFANAKAATAEEEAVIYAALASGGQLDEEQFASFIATLTSQQEALLAFSVAATGSQRELVNATVTGDAVGLADQTSIEVSRSVGTQPAVSADDASRAIGAVNDLMRWAEIRLEDQLVADAEAVRSEVIQQVLVESILVLVALVIAIALAVVLARSLVQSLSLLRVGALAVANHDLPEAVNRLRDVRSLGEGGVEAVTTQARDPIRLPNRDEVGQVAQAFNVVHREAVRIAAEQAALRTSVSAMFLNLARRSQALVDRMIGELDHIERTEEDPKRLAQLFQLDHLATRMRRNDENLLVLAGADSAAPRRENALLIDAVRAAQSEVELYNRIEFGTVDADIEISAPAVNDVVRLLAELLDNATRFSPPNTIVVAEARRIRDYVLIQIEDRGLGISEEQLDALNRRLAEPPPADVDVAAFRLMGLAVVGRLAARYGIRVELRNNAEGGTVAHVSLPGSILILPQHRGREPLSAAVPTQRTTEPAAVAPRNGHLSLADAGRPALPTRRAAATLTDGWDPAPSPWDAPPESPALASQVTSAHPTLAPSPESPYAAGYGSELISTAYTAPAPPPPPRTEEAPIFREMEASWFRTHDPANLEPWAMPTAGHPPPPAPTVAPMSPAPSAGTAGTGNGYGRRSDASLRADGTTTPAGRAAAPAGPTATPTSPPAGSSGNGFGSSPYAGSGQSGGGSGRSGGDRSAGASGFGGGRTQDHGNGSAGAAAPPPAAQPPPPRGYSPPEVPTDASTRGGGEEASWQTRADEGWRLASQAAQPAAGGTTRSGLPKRVPQAQLVPGGVEPAGSRERTRRTPDEVRGLLSAYHRGVQRGRSAGDDPGVDRPQSKENNR